MDKKNYNSIDLFKFIMSIFVVAIHVNPLYHFQNKCVNNIYSSVMELAVPFFFIASGFFLSNKMKNGKQFWDYNTAIVKKSLFSFLKMYLIWSMLYLPLDIVHAIKESVSFITWLKTYFQYLFFYGEHYNSWMLWYLLSTVYTLVIVLIWLKTQRSYKVLLVVALIFLIISIVCDYISIYQLPGTFRYINKLLKYTFINGRIFRGFIYIPIGLMIGRIRIRKLTQIILFFSGLLINLLFNGVFGTIGLVLCSIGLFYIIIDIRFLDSVWFFICRKMSLAIYLIHLYIWTILYSVIYGYKYYGLKMFIGTLLISTIIALFYALFCVKKKDRQNDIMAKE